MLTIEKQSEIQEIARQALLKERAYEKSIRKTELLTEISEKLKYVDFGKNYFEPFNESSFEEKVAVDLLYLKQILQKLDESHNVQVHELIAQTYRTIRNIYEFVNIKPNIYGKDIDAQILENSIEVVEEKLKIVLENALDGLFYSLTPEQRNDKYSNKAVPIARLLITENNDAEDSIEFSIKICVLEELFTKIAFPGADWLRVKHLTESEDFGLVFDQQELVELVENFEKKANKLAKYLAACV